MIVCVRLSLMHAWWNNHRTSDALVTRALHMKLNGSRNSVVFRTNVIVQVNFISCSVTRKFMSIACHSSTDTVRVSGAITTSPTGHKEFSCYMSINHSWRGHNCSETCHTSLNCLPSLLQGLGLGLSPSYIVALQVSSCWCCRYISILLSEARNKEHTHSWKHHRKLA